MLYNYGGTPDRVDNSQWANTVDNMQVWQPIGFDTKPELAYELWLRSLGLSNTQERSLRAAQSSIYDSYLGNQFLGAPQQTSRWVDYLKNFDPNKELGRLAPQARYEDASKFLRPARVVAF